MKVPYRCKCDCHNADYQIMHMFPCCDNMVALLDLDWLCRGYGKKIAEDELKKIEDLVLDRNDYGNGFIFIENYQQ